MFFGVISFGGSLWFMGPCSLSLTLFCVFGFLRFLGCLEGVCVRCDEPFPFDLLLFAPSHIMSLILHIVCWFSVGRLLLLQDRESVSSSNLI